VRQHNYKTVTVARWQNQIPVCQRRKTQLQNNKERNVMQTGKISLFPSIFLQHKLPGKDLILLHAI